MLFLFLFNILYKHKYKQNVGRELSYRGIKIEISLIAVDLLKNKVLLFIFLRVLR